MTTFSDFPLLASLQATLVEQGMTQPSDIQAQAIPALLDGRSVVGVAETGSGKTLAYVLPVLHLLKTLENAGQAVKVSRQPRAVVMVPTRELGEQVARIFKPFTHTTRLRVRSVLGGTTLEVAKKNIAGAFEILVATPGRLVKLLERGLIRLDDVNLLVFDEADQMVDQGFLPDSTRIAEACAPGRQLALFSATVPPAVEQLIADVFTGAEVLRSKGSHRVVPTLKTLNRPVLDGKRLPVLASLLKEPAAGGTMIFTNTREQCDQLASDLQAQQRPCVVYRGSMDKLERRANLKAFRDGQVDLLISTDLASRGLDVDHVGRVINYFMPYQMDNYLHRVGRTARAGREGLVVNFVTEKDRPLLDMLEEQH